MAKKNAAQPDAVTPEERRTPAAQRTGGRTEASAGRRSSAARRAREETRVNATSAEAIDRAADRPLDQEPSAARTPSYEEIAEAAYHRYLKRGGTHGSAFEDWLEAERELKQRQ